MKKNLCCSFECLKLHTKQNQSSNVHEVFADCAGRHTKIVSVILTSAQVEREKDLFLTCFLSVWTCDNWLSEWPFNFDPSHECTQCCPRLHPSVCTHGLVWCLSTAHHSGQDAGGCWHSAAPDPDPGPDPDPIPGLPQSAWTWSVRTNRRATKVGSRF